MAKAYPEPIGFDDVRLVAESRGWLTGAEPGRALSFGSALMKAAGGEPWGHRRSKHENSQRRAVRTYRAAWLDVPGTPSEG